MGFIKRNKFFVIAVVLALGLLGAAGFYDYQSWNRNDTAFTSLDEIYKTLKELATTKPSPGNDKVDNIAAANEQEQELREWIRQAGKYFQPIGRIPDANSRALKSEEFGNALNLTIAQLQQDARSANVALPPDYGFSFTAERNRLTFAPGSLEPLAVQLGEVKAISEILFAAQVNSLDGVQRLRVSDDDTAGPQSDYIDDTAQTNDLAVLTPYQITFRAFSPEIAHVLAGFGSSPHGFIIKGINVQGGEGDGDAASPTGMPMYPGTGPAPYPGTGPAPYPGTGPAPYPGTTTTAPTAAGKGGLQTVFKEQLLRVTIEVEIIKLSPKR